MPDFIISRLMITLNKRRKALAGSKVCVLGLAYKPNVDDMRESPSIILIGKLEALGARVTYNDPYISRTPRQREHNLRITSRMLTPRFLAAQDAVLISTNHSGYDYAWTVANSQLVIDTRNATRDVTEGRDKIVKA